LIGRKFVVANASVGSESAPTDAIEPWPMATLRDTLIKIGARVVQHGRHVTFQRAGMASPRRPLAEMPRLIDGLRPKPAPT
jgi:hypothetical protein